MQTSSWSLSCVIGRTSPWTDGPSITHIHSHTHYSLHFTCPVCIRKLTSTWREHTNSTLKGLVGLQYTVPHYIKLMKFIYLLLQIFFILFPVFSVFFNLCYEWNVCFLNKNCSQCYDETSKCWDLCYQTLLLVWVSFGAEINCLVKIRVSNADCMNSFENVASVLNNVCYQLIKNYFFLPYTDYYTLMRLASNYINTVYIYILLIFYLFIIIYLFIFHNFEKYCFSVVTKN